MQCGGTTTIQVFWRGAEGQTRVPRRREMLDQGITYYLVAENVLENVNDVNHGSYRLGVTIEGKV